MTSILWQLASLYSARSRSFISYYYLKLYKLIGQSVKSKGYIHLTQSLPTQCSKNRRLISIVSKVVPFVNIDTYIHIENLARYE